MPRVDLYSLLEKHQIYHPTRLVACVAANGELRIEFSGQVWWKADATGDEEGQIAFIFVRPNSGAIGADLLGQCGDPERDEVLDGFYISRTKADNWADYPNISIYGSAPMPDPMALVEHLGKYLQDANAYKQPSHFLNGPTATFARNTQASAYLIGHAPGSIAEVICRELDRQGAVYYCNRGPRQRDNRFIVYWGDTGFQCEAAYAEFD
jgi:hypothetical protein